MFVTVLWLTSLTFSQTTDTVWVEILHGDTVLVMTPEKGREIAADLIAGDSCCVKVQYLEKKIDNYLVIIQGDSIALSNLELDLEKAIEQQEKLGEQKDIVEERLEISESEKKRFRRQRFMWGASGGAFGVLIGIVTGIILTN